MPALRNCLVSRYPGTFVSAVSNCAARVIAERPACQAIVGGDQRRPARLKAEPTAAASWLREFKQFWSSSFDQLDDLLEELKKAATPESGLWVGDAWVATGSSLGLLVPSVVASEERNLVLNPSHPRFQEVRVLSKQRVALDRRLYSTSAKRHRAGRKGKKR